ncbi:MAG: hypothetical protein KatS3mg048_3012 [Caldilinea sp.]|nr:MAG: hypothetical protein KatS3mg048_3012 [Caldilinea sp.]
MAGASLLLLPVLSWNVTSGPGDAVQWTAIRQGVTESLGSSATGSIAFGCAYYQVHNGGADPVTLDLRVVVDTP